MIVQCPSCQTKFSVDTARVQSSANPRFHCSRCDHLFHLKKSSQREGRNRASEAAAADPRQLSLLTSSPLGSSPTVPSSTPFPSSNKASFPPSLSADERSEYEHDPLEGKEEWEDELSEEGYEEEESGGEEEEEELYEDEWGDEDSDYSLNGQECDGEASEEELLSGRAFPALTAEWPKLDSSQPYEADIGRGIRSSLTVRQSGSFIPEKSEGGESLTGDHQNGGKHQNEREVRPEERTAPHTLHPDPAKISSLHSRALHGVAPQGIESHSIESHGAEPDTLKRGSDARASLEARVLEAERFSLKNPLHKPLRSRQEDASVGLSRLDQPIRHQPNNHSFAEHNRGVVNFPEPSSPSEFKRRKRSLLPSVLFYGAFFCSPLLFLFGLWGIVASPPIARLLQIGSASLPRVPPREIELVDITSETITLANGTKVIEIMGRAINTSTKSYRDVVIEAQLYDEQNQAVQRVTAPLNNKLFEAGSLTSLAVDELRTLQATSTPKLAELRPQSGAPFRIILEEHSEARWFGARVRSVQKL